MAGAGVRRVERSGLCPTGELVLGAPVYREHHSPGPLRGASHAGSFGPDDSRNDERRGEQRQAEARERYEQARRDVDAAKRHLAAAGYAGGLTLSVIVSQGEYATSVNHDPDGDCLPGQPGTAAEGSFSANTFTSSPSTTSEPSRTSTVPG